MQNPDTIPLRWRGAVVTVFVLAVAVAGCSATPSATPTGTTPRTASATAPEPATPGPLESPTSQPGVDLSARPLVLFAPLPPNTPHMGYGGSEDFLDLFAPGAPWKDAEQHVDVFSIASSWVQNYASDEQLKAVIDGVAARGLALGLEIGPYTGEPCGAGIEGNDLNDYPFNRIHSLGGRIDVVSWDEPMAFATHFDGPNACHWTFEQAAAGIATAAERVRALEPDALIGDIEPIWTNLSPDDYGAWLDSYATAVGRPPAFIHIDVDWDNLPEWPSIVRAIEGDARSRGVRFGVIYNGGFVDSDDKWANLSMQRAAIYEEQFGGQLDDVVFGSWMDHPDRALPDSDPTTFTGLIDRYFGARTVIEVADVSADRGTLEATITASQLDGAPIPGASLSVSLRPLDGMRQTLSLEGVVPDGVHVAVVGFRVNTENAGIGPAELRVYEVAYSEGPDNLLSNARFSKDLNDWYVYGDGRASTPASDAGGGQMLRLKATAKQKLSVDHANIKVAPGSPFRLDISAAIPEASASSAYGAVMFQLGDQELERQILPLKPQLVGLGDFTTDAAGSLALNVASGLAPGRYELRVDYAGDASRWPSSATTEIVVR